MPPDKKINVTLFFNMTSLRYSADRIYMRLDSRRDGLHAFPITRMWPEVTSGVDAVFSFSDKLYAVKVGLELPTEKTFSLKHNPRICFQDVKLKCLLLLLLLFNNPSRTIKCTSTRAELTTP